MTKMAALPIYGENPSKFFFSGTTGPISTKLGMKHRGLEYYNVFINYHRVHSKRMKRGRNAWSAAFSRMTVVVSFGFAAIFGGNFSGKFLQTFIWII